jgi:hypothetical protein
MPASSPLPGLDRLIVVCQQHSLPLELSSPLPSAPRPGELVLGEPFDPQLAAAYQRLGAAEFGPLTLYGPHSGEQGLLQRNEWLRQYDWVHLRSILVFGKKTGHAYYCGTVPQLGSGQGLQPVVYIDCHETIFAVPIASSVDRFFDLYSRYLELLAADSGYGQSGAMLITFPWRMTHLITRDEPLMEQVLAGRFDFLADNYRDGLEWLQRLRTARL